MTLLKKFEIAGIRSFHPGNEAQTITFDEPITVITGANGTGKTSIIEALQASIIGELDKNTELISNLNVWSKEEVQAKIACEFQSNDIDYRVELTPSLKKNNQTIKGEKFQTGGCILTTQSGDQKKEEDIPTSSIGSLIPRLFSASVPLIKYVIFCKQEDSSWPIDSNLKPIFEKIFDTQRYTLVKQEFSKINHSFSEQLKEIQDNITRDESNLLRLEEIEQDIHNSAEEISKIQGQIEIFEPQFLKIEGCYNQYNKMKPEIDQIEREIHTLQGQMHSEKSSYERKEKLIINKVSFDECKISHKQFQDDLDSKDSQLELDKQQLRKTQSEEESIQKGIESIQKDVNTRKSNYAGYTNLVNRFETDYHSTDFHQILNNKRMNYFKIKEAKEKAVQNQNESLKIIEEEIEGLKQSLMEEEKKIDCCRRDVESFHDKLKQYEHVDEHEISKEEDALDRIRSLKRKLLQMNEITKSLQECDQPEEGANISELTNQLGKLNEEKETVMKLQQCNAKIKDASTQMKTQLEIIRRKLDRNDMTSDNFENLFDLVESAVDQEYRKSQSEMQEYERKLELIGNKLQNLQENIREEQKKYDNSMAKINAMLSPEDGDYSSLLKKLRDTNKCEKEKLIHIQDIKIEDVYTDFKKKAHSGHCCPLCERRFSNEPEFELFVKTKIEKTISSIPNEIKSCNAKIKDLDKRINQLEEIQNDIQIRDQFLSKKPKQEKEMEQLVESQKDAHNRVILAHEKRIEAQKKRDSIAEIQHDIIQLKVLKETIHNAENEKQNLPLINEKRQSIDQISNAIEQINDRIQELKDQEKRDEECRESVHKLEIEEQEKENRIKLLHEYYEKKMSLKQKISMSNQSIQEQLSIINSLQEKIVNKRNEKQRIDDENRGELTKLGMEFLRAEIDYKSCENLVSKIDDYQKANVDGKKTMEQIQQQENELKILKNNLFKIKQSISELNSRIDQNENERRSINDQLNDIKIQEEYYEYFNKYQELTKEKEKLDQEKQSLLEQVGNESYDSVSNSFFEMKSHYDTLNSQLRQSNQKHDELIRRSQQFKDTRQALNQAKLAARCLTLSMNDIKLYEKSLNEALREYHTNRMDEVNRSIYRLWNNTYTGGDIDTIEIKCETERNNEVIDNYRVVMIKNGVEMNMNKTCSAGQKMLASIIIRLALAEIFCASCKIIALDEPTTNLDHNNASSLASSLIKLLNDKMKPNGKPYQMIIITHNKEFYQEMLNNSGIEKFYQITKAIDGNQKYSKIDQHEYISD